MPVRLNGSTSGYVDITAPAVAGTNTLTLPASTGTLIISSSPAITTPTITGNILNASGRPMVAQTGGILQVVQTVLTTTVSFSPTGAMQAVTGLSASITPSTTSSKILVLVNMSMGPAINAVIMGQLQRNGVAVGGGVANGSSPSINTAQYYVGTAANSPPAFAGQGTVHYLDSPATTSSVTYAMYVQGDSGASTIYINRTGRDSSAGGAIDGRASSTITLMEIAA